MNTMSKMVVFVLAVLVFASCKKATYRKTAGGMPYQLFRGEDSTPVKPGNFMKVSFTRKIKDSVYFTTVGTLPIYLEAPAQSKPYDISELWTSLHVGDSVVATQMIDTFMKRSPGQIPPQFKKGDKITYYIKVLEVFPNDSVAREDYEKNNRLWLANEVKTIEKFLADKNIQAQKTPSGAFVQILNPGTGNLIDSGKYITVNYNGTSWSGKKFDSSTDSAFGHVGPMPFVAGTGSMIKGFDEAVMFLRLGSKARIYIPSVLGYAGQPNSPFIKPYENLIFDVEVLDVQDKVPATPDFHRQQENVDGTQQNR